MKEERGHHTKRDSSLPPGRVTATGEKSTSTGGGGPALQRLEALISMTGEAFPPSHMGFSLLPMSPVEMTETQTKQGSASVSVNM